MNNLLPIDLSISKNLDIKPDMTDAFALLLGAVVRRLASWENIEPTMFFTEAELADLAIKGHLDVTHKDGLNPGYEVRLSFPDIVGRGKPTKPTFAATKINEDDFEEAHMLKG